MPENSNGHKAKGAMLVALAMVINNTRNLNWTKETDLTEADLQVIHKGIMSSIWYDRGLWERMGMAVFKLVGQGKPENAYLFGHGVLAETLLKIYHGPLAIDNPREILGKFALFYGNTWYNFGRAEFKSTPEGGVFKIFHSDGIPIPECFVPMVKGVLSRFIEENKARDVKVECEEESQIHSQKLNKLTINLTWG